MDTIVILCKSLLKGGAEKQALTLSKLLKEKNREILLINWTGDKVDSANSDYIQKHSLRCIGLTGNMVLRLVHFMKIIKNEKPSIILSYLTLPNIIAGLTKLLNRKIITIGGIRTEKLPFYKFLFEKIVHNHLNDATVFNNYSAKKKFELKGFVSRKIYVIHNTISIPNLEKINETEGEIKIISVSRFVKPKDFPTALKSVRKLISNNHSKRFKYFILGYGPLENEIRSLISDLNLDREVEILVNPPNIPDILKECDIYLSTSLYEGLSNSIMEAMVAGLPIIATDVGDNTYLVKDDYNGYLVPRSDVNSIVEKLEYLTNFDSARKEFGINSYNIIKTEFSEDRMTTDYLKLFTELSH
jgi:glycosyltransferase involved in cell wall biosynthesis